MRSAPVSSTPEAISAHLDVELMDIAYALETLPETEQIARMGHLISKLSPGTQLAIPNLLADISAASLTEPDHSDKHSHDMRWSLIQAAEKSSETILSARRRERREY